MAHIGVKIYFYFPRNYTSTNLWDTDFKEIVNIFQGPSTLTKMFVTEKVQFDRCFDFSLNCFAFGTLISKK